MYSIYEVKQNDTLDSIANDLNITKEKLIEINGDLKNIMQGQLIIVPTKSNYTIYTVKRGDTLYNIAKKYNIDVKSIMLFNGLKENEFLYPDQQLMIPYENIYVTDENDSLLDLIKKLNVTLEDFVNMNNKIYLQKDQILYYKKD